MSDAGREDRTKHEDEYGFIAPLPADTNIRKMTPDGFAAGPAIGERLPDFELSDHTGRRLRLHEHRGSSKAAVVFFRSAVW
jgi:hypothetical protein